MTAKTRCWVSRFRGAAGTYFVNTRSSDVFEGAACLAGGRAGRRAVVEGVDFDRRPIQVGAQIDIVSRAHSMYMSPTKQCSIKTSAWISKVVLHDDEVWVIIIPVCWVLSRVLRARFAGGVEGSWFRPT